MGHLRECEQKSQESLQNKEIGRLGKARTMERGLGFTHLGALVSGRDQLHFLGPSSLLFSYLLPKQL